MKKVLVLVIALSVVASFSLAPVFAASWDKEIDAAILNEDFEAYDASDISRREPFRDLPVITAYDVGRELHDFGNHTEDRRIISVTYDKYCRWIKHCLSYLAL